MIFTDTHTHLYSQEFDQDTNEMINRALEAGVSRLFMPAIDSTYFDKMWLIKQAYPENVFVMTGLHPTHVNPESYEQEMSFIQHQLTKHTFVAIGEIGIDLYWDKSYLKLQQQAFVTQIQWAKQYKLPIVIHGRDSFDEIFEILEQEKNIKGIFHCFTGTYEQACKAIDMGLHIGIGGVATFKNGKIADYLSKIPLQNVVLETDSPYLAPVPYRGKRNESAYIPLIAEKLATIYQTSLEHIAQVTTQNSKNIFGI